MALTGKQVLSMTPEEIAELMSDDISVNNGLIEEVVEDIPKKIKPQRMTTITEDLEELRMKHKFLTQPYHEVPTRISILPPKAYIQSQRPPAPKPRPPAKTGLCKRMIII